MRKLNHNIFTLALVMSILTQVRSQQTPMYSQYMFNMLNINPAYAGMREAGNFNMLVRKQWVNFPGAPTSGSISYDQRLNGKNNGLGAQVYFDRIGIESTTGVQGYYSYSAPMGAATLNLGMSLGVLNYASNYTSTNPFDAGDPSLMNNVQGYLPTAGFGAILESEKWYLAFSAPALFKTKLSENGKGVLSAAGKEGHYFLTAGYILPLTDDTKLKPSVLVKTVSGTKIQYDLNLNLWFGNLMSIGSSYRTEDAVLGMMELQLNPQLRLGYAYDYNISKLFNYNKGTHEFMLRYELGRLEGKKIQSPRYF